MYAHMYAQVLVFSSPASLLLASSNNAEATKEGALKDAVRPYGFSPFQLLTCSFCSSSSRLLYMFKGSSWQWSKLGNPVVVADNCAPAMGRAEIE